VGSLSLLGVALSPVARSVVRVPSTLSGYAPAYLVLSNSRARSCSLARSSDTARSVIWVLSRRLGSRRGSGCSPRRWLAPLFVVRSSYWARSFLLAPSLELARCSPILARPSLGRRGDRGVQNCRKTVQGDEAAARSALAGSLAGSWGAKVCSMCPGAESLFDQ
jgi:hypothetical protein